MIYGSSFAPSLYKYPPPHKREEIRNRFATNARKFVSRIATIVSVFQFEIDSH
jgi:hypothetical protein